MPHYFFHLIDSKDAVLDPEGVEIAAEAFVDATLLQARDCMAADVKGGRLDLHYRIDVHDHAGNPVHSLTFEDALEIVPAR